MPGMKKGTVLIIDDEEDLRMLLARVLELEDYKVFTASSPTEAFKILDNIGIEVIVSDVRLEVANGVELIPEYKKRKPFAEIIMLTAYGNISDGVTSIKSGAFEYLTKGDDNYRIVAVVDQAIQKCRLSGAVFKMDEAQAGGFEKIVGESKAIKDAINLANKVAKSDASVLLTGETGTGKEVFASAIHEASKRAESPYLAINCSALSKEILESELFGHVKGAFTGAAADKKGFFEAAKGGTLFLDEIGEMNLELQAKLLRVLETGLFFKVGSTKELKSDVRIIAATNRNLMEESDKGNFRLDLYYRLSTFTIELPPLRERGDDILVLANHFVKMAASKMGSTPPKLSNELQKFISSHHWKGNLRELKNMMERAVILAETGVLDTDLLPQEFQNGRVQAETGLRPNLAIDLQSLEKDHISNMLQFTGGNKTKTAEILGIGVATLYRKIQEYEIVT